MADTMVCIMAKGVLMAALPEQEYMTLQEVAKLLRVNVATVRSLIRDKRLIGFKVGRRWRVSREALQAFIAKQETTQEGQ